MIVKRHKLRALIESARDDLKMARSLFSHGETFLAFNVRLRAGTNLKLARRHCSALRHPIYALIIFYLMRRAG